MKKPELLAPAGDWPSLLAAIESKADAIYLGVQEFNMRAKASNFKISELKKITSRCHKHKVKAYLTLNSIIYENELKILNQILAKAKEANVDAVICWDHAVIKLAKKYSLPIHLSTQASVSNSEAIKFYKSQGVKRIILARELNLSQIKELAKHIEVEVFIHGALCYSISGRCFFSQELYKKSANRGECIQPCRRRYLLTDLETNKQIQTENNYFLSPKDLCTLPFLDKIIKSGVTALKIEGRNRSPEYVKIVTQTYREAIDNSYNKNLLIQLETAYNRHFSTGFYLGLPTQEDLTNLHGSASTEKKEELGIIINYYKKQKVAVLRLDSKTISLGEEILIIGNKTGVFRQKIVSLEVNHLSIKTAKKGDLVAFKAQKQVRPHDRVYKIIRRKL